MIVCADQDTKGLMAVHALSVLLNDTKAVGAPRPVKASVLLFL